jgi:hypothetical protein
MPRESTIVLNDADGGSNPPSITIPGTVPQLAVGLARGASSCEFEFLQCYSCGGDASEATSTPNRSAGGSKPSVPVFLLASKALAKT